MGYNGLYNVIHIIKKNRCWCRIPHSCCADPHSMDPTATVSVGLVRHCQPCRRAPEDVLCTQRGGGKSGQAAVSLSSKATEMSKVIHALTQSFPMGGVLCKDFMKHDFLKRIQ